MVNDDRPPARRLLSLLDEPAEGTSEPPTGEGWRPGVAYRSPHSRLDALPRPGESYDVDRAATICREATVELLGPLAPALELLPEGIAARLAALLTYARTLFDFAAQPGLEGERLAQINRLEFTLESALDGAPIGQPSFLRMAAEEARQAWPRPALDALANAARQRIVGDQRVAEPERLAATLLLALLGERPPTSLAEWLTLQLRLAATEDLAERQQLGAAIAAGRPNVDQWPAELRSAARFAIDAAALLAQRRHDDRQPFGWLRLRRLLWNARRS